MSGVSYPIKSFAASGSNTILTIGISSNTTILPNDPANTPYNNGQKVIIQNSRLTALNGYWNIVSTTSTTITLNNTGGTSYTTPSNITITSLSFDSGTLLTTLNFSGTNPYSIGDSVQISFVYNLTGVYIVKSRTSSSITVGFSSAPTSIYSFTCTSSSILNSVTCTSTSYLDGVSITYNFTATAVNIAPGSSVVISGFTPASYNGTFNVVSSTSTSITIDAHIFVPSTVNGTITLSNTQATFNFSSTTTDNILPVGNQIITTGFTSSTYNSTFQITASTATSVTVSLASTTTTAPTVNGKIQLVGSVSAIVYPTESAYIKNFVFPLIRTTSGYSEAGGSSSLPGSLYADFTFLTQPFAPFTAGSNVLLQKAKPGGFNNIAVVESCTTNSIRVYYGVSQPPASTTCIAFPTIQLSSTGPAQTVLLQSNQQTTYPFGNVNYCQYTTASGYTISNLNTLANIHVGSTVAVWGFSNTVVNVSGVVADLTQIGSTVQIGVTTSIKFNYFLPASSTGYMFQGTNQPSLTQSAMKISVSKSAVVPNTMAITMNNYTVSTTVPSGASYTQAQTSYTGDAFTITPTGVATVNGILSINNNIPQTLDIGTISSRYSVSAIIYNGNSSGSGTTIQALELCTLGVDNGFSSSATNGDSVIKATGNLYIQSGSGAAACQITTSNNFNLRTAIQIGGSSGSSGQVLTSSGGSLNTWTTPTTGTVTSIGITVPSYLSVSPSSITSSGTFAITGSSTGTGSTVVLSASPTISGNLNLSSLTVSTALALDSSKNIVSVTNTGSGNNVLSASPTLTGTLTAGVTILTPQTLQVLTFNGTNLKPAFIGCQYTGISFGSLLSYGVNLLGTTGGTSYSTSTQGGRFIVSTDTTSGSSIYGGPTGTIDLYTWTGKQAGSDTETIVLTMDYKGALSFYGTTSGTVTARALGAITSYNWNYPTTVGTAGQVLTTQAGGINAMTWTTPTTGTVTSVGMTVPSFLTVSPSSITSSGTFAVTLSGTALPVSSGGTGTTTSTGTGSVVLSASPTFTGTITATNINATSASDLTLTASSGGQKISLNCPISNTGIILNAFYCYIDLNSTYSHGFALISETATTASSIQGAVTLYGSLTLSTAIGGTGAVTASSLSLSTALSVSSGGTGTTTSTGTGSVVLSASPTLTGTLTAATTILTPQALQVLTFNGTNLLPAFIGCEYNGISFGPRFSFGVNLSGTTGGSSYDSSQQGGRFYVSTASNLFSWTGKAGGSNTENVIMTLSSSGTLTLTGAVTASSLSIGSTSTKVPPLCTSLFQIDKGITTAGGNGTYGPISFNFTFTNTPIVVASMDDAATCAVYTRDVTTTGFKAVVTGSASGASTIRWIAIG